MHAQDTMLNNNGRTTSNIELTVDHVQHNLTAVERAQDRTWALKNYRGTAGKVETVETR